MAIQTQYLDPNAAAYTDNDIVTKVNNATNDITRAGSVSAAARPIAANEIGSTEIAGGAVGSTELAASAAKDNLDAMPDTARGYIKTSPTTGQYPVTSIQRHTDGRTEVEYDDVPV